MRPNTRSRIAGQSAAAQLAPIPNRPACRTACATSAVCTSIFDGMHPLFRQVPPNRSLSTTAIRQSASSSVGNMFPLPAPTITRS